MLVQLQSSSVDLFALAGCELDAHILVGLPVFACHSGALRRHKVVESNTTLQRDNTGKAATDPSAEVRSAVS